MPASSNPWIEKRSQPWLTLQTHTIEENETRVDLHVVTWLVTLMNLGKRCGIETLAPAERFPLSISAIRCLVGFRFLPGDRVAICSRRTYSRSYTHHVASKSSGIMRDFSAIYFLSRRFNLRAFRSEAMKSFHKKRTQNRSSDILKYGEVQ